MRYSNLLPRLACLGLMACGSGAQLTNQEMAVEQQALNSLLAEWERAVNSLKPDSMALHVHRDPGFVGIWSDGRRTTGWEAESTATMEFVGRTSALNLDVQNPNTQVLSRSVAFTTFRHTIDLTDSVVGRQLFSGFGTLVWVKDPADRSWKIHARQISRNPLAPAPTRR